GQAGAAAIVLVVALAVDLLRSVGVLTHGVGRLTGKTAARGAGDYISSVAGWKDVAGRALARRDGAGGAQRFGRRVEAVHQPLEVLKGRSRRLGERFGPVGRRPRRGGRLPGARRRRPAAARGEPQ